MQEQNKIKDKCSLPSCENELIHKEGRKKKKYCCTNHSVRHWQMLNPKKAPKTKQIPMEEWKEIEAKLSAKSVIEPMLPAIRGLMLAREKQNKARKAQNTPNQLNPSQEVKEGKEGGKECVKEQNSGSSIPPMPKREDFPEGINGAIDFGAAKNIWKKNNQK